jgi:hypothetical protein
MHADTAAVLADPVLKAHLGSLGVFAVGSTPGGVRRYLKAETDKRRGGARRLGSRSASELRP